MKYGVTAVLRYWLGRDIAGRNLQIHPDDTFIVSYPRSGNTWTRFLVANLLRPAAPVTFQDIERIVPDSEAQSSRYLKALPRPRVIKSHEYFHPRFRKVIYIVRDPRDVALSYYDFQRKYRHIEDGYPISQYARDFVDGRHGLADWGSWAENVSSWVSTRQGRPGFLLLRYEDMVRDTRRELSRVASFLGISPAPDLLENAISRSSAERLRELERLQGHEWVSTKDKRADIPFIRTATAGGWKANLPPDAVSIIEMAWGTLMQSLGYEVSRGEAELSLPETVSLRSDLSPSFHEESSG